MESLYVCCINCGHRFGKYDPGSGHETVCPHCKAELKIESKENSVVVHALRVKDQQPHNGKKGAAPGNNGGPLTV